MARLLVLIPSTTYRARDFLEAASRLGVEVTVGSEEVHTLSAVMGSRALEVPLSDPETAARAIVDHDRRCPLDAIVAVDDQGTIAAARASELLGLPHNPPHAAIAARDKLVMRRALETAEVRQPRFTEIAPDAEDSRVAASVLGVGLPCVVKPTTLSASQGVLRADSVEEAVKVVGRVRAIAAAAGTVPGAPLLAESYVAGAEVAVEGLLDEGELRVLAVFDKPDPMEGPSFEETIYVTPSSLPPGELRSVTDTAAAAARAIGLRQGPVHVELRVCEGRAFLIEIAARTIGGLCSRALSFSTGRTLEELVIAAALGLDTASMQLCGRASGVLMLPVASPGILRKVDGVHDALSVPGITDVSIALSPGAAVVPVPEGNRYLGFVFARARSASAVVSALRRAWSKLDVQIDPHRSSSSESEIAAGA